MSDVNYSTELISVIGDPTPSLVAETLLVLLQRSGDRFVWPMTLANAMYDMDDDGRIADIDEAYELIRSALLAGEIRDIDTRGPDDLGNTDSLWRPDENRLGLDDLVRLRLERRQQFWQLDQDGVAVPAHLTGETIVDRAAIAAHQDTVGLPPTTAELMAAIVDVAGVEPRFAPRHIALNALDAGAVAAHAVLEDWGSYAEHWWVLTDWTHPDDRRS